MEARRTYFPDQGLNSRPPALGAESQPLDHQEVSPAPFFLNLFLAALGLCFGTQGLGCFGLSLVGMNWGYCLVVVPGPPIVVDFHVADQGL